MTARFECLITGCALDMAPGFHWGDLHERGDTWVFNAVLGMTGEPVLLETEYMGSRVINMVDVEFFERRGVFVFQRDTSLMNEAAKKYVGVV